MKGSKANAIRISPRLRKAITKAQQLRAKPKLRRIDEDLYLFPNNQGERMSVSALQRRMTILKKKMQGMGEFWTLHNLKHKAQTDAKDKDVAGLSETTKKIYDHSKPIVDPVK
jgi:site-specific recombinase XerC